jgi:phosphate starvation-inducible PhoH-like protein
MSRKKTTRTPKQKQNYNVNETLIEAKTNKQSALIKCLNNDSLVICDGPAGTGKTFVAAGVACEHLLNKKVSKIVISRSTQQCGDSGYLPGPIEEKLKPFMNPILSKLEYFLGSEVYKKMLLEKVIEIYPLETMRGETLDDCFMILTEFQNATYEQIMMFATRIGKNTTCVLEGDLMQIDNRRSGGKRFHDEQKRSEGKGEGISYVYFTEDDIVRSGIVKTIINNARAAYTKKD